ncbi:autotransporter outer membrane beta-barrel domain-containing protein [Rickettsia koreansis]|uniref:autotransporter outer membrane beta-barrel domain-containing protein n=1 Tax=Rickettsia koreansis TaxID=2358204 RepID=UPI00397A7FCE
MASSVTEYSEPWQDPDTPIGEAFETEFSMEQQIEPTAPPLSVFSSLEDLHISADASLGEEERVMKMLDEAIEDSGYSGSSCGGVDDWSGEDSISDTGGYDTVYTSSGSEYSEDSSDEDWIPFPPPPTAEELVELEQLSEVSNPEQTLTASISSEMQEESEYHVDSDILTQETVAKDDLQNSITEADDAAPSNEPCVQSTSMSQEELRKKAEATSAMHNQARKMSKISSKQIRHRIFARDIVTAAVASGDDDADDAAEKTHGYSIWSSGTLGSNKQKSKADSNGYSSKIAGGTIGANINLENDLLLGASFSRFNSRVKYQDQGGSSDLRSSGTSARAKYDTYIFSLYGSRPVSRNMSVAIIGSAGHSKGKKVRSKLMSFEPHLNYRVEMPREVTLIPHIGLRYEYEKVSRHKAQIASSWSIECSKKSYQALSGEIGSRVIFKSIRLNEDAVSNAISTTSITPTVPSS